MANKYCGNCGTEIPEGARFCLNCGQSFEHVDSIHNSKKEHKVNKKSLYALAVVFGILLLIIAGAMYYADYTDRREARLAREKFVADSLEAARQDSLVQIEKREKEKQEAIAAQKKKMPTVNQVLNIWKRIEEIRGHDSNDNYQYKYVTSKNMKPLAKNISGLELLLCKVGKSYEKVDMDNPKSRYKYFNVPVVCYGINSKVKDETYDTLNGASVKFVATSDHACAFFWTPCEYDTAFDVLFFNKEDAIAFFNQIKYINDIDENSYKRIKGYEDNWFALFSKKPEYVDGWYVIHFRIPT